MEKKRLHFLAISFSSVSYSLYLLHSALSFLKIVSIMLDKNFYPRSAPSKRKKHMNAEVIHSNIDAESLKYLSIYNVLSPTCTKTFR